MNESRQLLRFVNPIRFRRRTSASERTPILHRARHASRPSIYTVAQRRLSLYNSYILILTRVVHTFPLALTSAPRSNSTLAVSKCLSFTAIINPVSPSWIQVQHDLPWGTLFQFELKIYHDYRYPLWCNYCMIESDAQLRPCHIRLSGRYTVILYLSYK